MTEVQTYYHGTKADLKIGDLIAPGYASNYGQRKQAAFVYLAATLEAAIWGAELAVGEGRGRIYIVEPTGAIEDDPNLTDKKFPGNPTRSYRSRDPFRVIGEVAEWEGHSPERLKEMHDRLETLKQLALRRLNSERGSGIQLKAARRSESLRDPPNRWREVSIVLIHPWCVLRSASMPPPQSAEADFDLRPRCARRPLPNGER